MLQVLKSEVYTLKKDKIKKPPWKPLLSKSELIIELSKTINQIKVNNKEQMLGFDLTKPPNMKWLIEMLFNLIPNHEASCPNQIWINQQIMEKFDKK